MNYVFNYKSRNDKSKLTQRKWKEICKEQGYKLRN